MVSTEYFESESNFPNTREFVGRLVLRPNSSMSWQAARYFLATLMIISFTMALAFTSLGYWLILPFTGLEMIVLAGCFYYLIVRNQTQEVLSFSAEQVVIEVGRNGPDVHHDWPRFFTKVIVRSPRHPWYPSTVVLRCRDQECEVGKFLTAIDKTELIRELRLMIVAADKCRTMS